MKDFRTFFNYLHRNKLFTFVNVVGLGISLMFVLLLADMVGRQLTVERGQKDADRTYVFANDQCSGAHYVMAQKLQSRYPEIEDWCAYSGNASQFFNVKEQVMKVKLGFVRKNFFQFFNYRLTEGNPEQVFVDDNSVVLSQSAARKLFGDKPALGQTLAASDGTLSLTVTGVMEDFSNSLFTESTEALIPYENARLFNPSISVDDESMGNAASAMLFFRSVKGSDINAHNADMVAYLKEIFWFYTRGIAKEVHFIPLRDFYFYEGAPACADINQYSFKMVLFYLGIGLLILLMAVFNYVSMSIAQTSYRAKEMATRRLLGSSRPDIFWRMIAESFLLTFIAFALGFLLALLAEPTAMDLLRFKLDLLSGLNIVTGTIYLILILLISILSGFVPATILSNYNPLDVVKGTFRRKTKAIYLRALNIVQNGMTIGLLGCTLYLSTVIHRVLNEPLGYEYGDVLNVSPNGTMQALYTFRNEALKFPYVKRISFTQGTPFDGGNNNTMSVMVNGADKNVSFQSFVVDSAFLDIFHIRISEDRQLPYNPNNWFVSERAMKDLGGNCDKVIDSRKGRNFTIAGQFKDFHIRSIMSEQHPLRMKVLPTDSIGPWDILVEVKEGSDLPYCRKQLTDLLTRLNGGIPVGSKWYKDQITDQYKHIFRTRKLVNIFTGAALLISVLGLTAMSLYFIAQRKQDMAIRKVFGSTQANETGRLIKFSLTSLGFSLLIAVPLMATGIHFINIYTEYETGFPWWIPLTSVLAVTALTLILVCLISRKAVRENPVKHLKTE